MGALPTAAGWVRLEVPASAINFEQKNLDGIWIRLFDGQAWFDHIGKAAASTGEMAIPSTSTRSGGLTKRRSVILAHVRNSLTPVGTARHTLWSNNLPSLRPTDRAVLTSERTVPFYCTPQLNHGGDATNEVSELEMRHSSSLSSDLHFRGELLLSPQN
jgi:hypothetical protein